MKTTLSALILGLLVVLSASASPSRNSISSGSFTTLYSFSENSDGGYPDGAVPDAALALGSDGNLYGTTTQGGGNNAGTVFRITSSGSLTTLFSFEVSNVSQQANPGGSMVENSNGDFYGTTYTEPFNGIEKMLMARSSRSAPAVRAACCIHSKAITSAMDLCP